MLAASTQSKRQRIQRIGRTLRRGDGDKRPIVITLSRSRNRRRERMRPTTCKTSSGVATIHDESERTCIARIESLGKEWCGGARPGGSRRERTAGSSRVGSSSRKTSRFIFDGQQVLNRLKSEIACASATASWKRERWNTASQMRFGSWVAARLKTGLCG